MSQTFSKHIRVLYVEIVLNLPLISGPMRDFTLETFTLLLQALKSQGYTFQTFRDFLKAPAPKAIVLRHDVDARKLNSLQTAQLEAKLGIAGTYNFRMVPQSFDPDIIREIAALGHEIGYHYEDLAMAGKKGRVTRDKGQEKQGQVTSDERQGRSKEDRLYQAAIKSFESNLGKLRQVAPVDTICMHGSPLSRYDNRKIWEKYDYRNYGIIGEPYFDVDFSKVLYLTDTGRRWDGGKVSVRDKVPASIMQMKGKIKIQSTFDIVDAAKSASLPPKMMINVHPQRWADDFFLWVRELLQQGIKNQVKRIILKGKVVF